jgi:hypothetical protein
MTQSDAGEWTWGPAIAEGREWLEKYVALVRKWNAAVTDFNELLRPRNFGRPLAASEAQCEQVRKLRKRGVSLRGIAEETNLGLQTVRIIDGGNGVDRTTLKYFERIAPDRVAERRWEARRRTRDALPKRINKTLADGRELVPGIHEIKHDGFRMMVRRDAAGVRLLTRNSHDWTARFPSYPRGCGGAAVLLPDRRRGHRLRTRRPCLVRAAARPPPRLAGDAVRLRPDTEGK